ncbi:G-protein coupled receptor GRL101 [Stylophora pistillata]|uniref:G-protein coupled receptor GRL101 n=1 Tax=Stylophora pistillata TaxID=50429 RepID=A0A2B4R4C9_STYPI|nr:G-protein coupled receptor GRL101 [Stylophora pistillata]
MNPSTVDTNLMCCHLTKEDADCDFAYVDSFASCENMLRDRAPRKCIWVVGIMSLIGAVFVITWRMVYRERNIAQPIMLTHLAVSDGLMGIYLITIGVMDAIWAGQYYLHDYSWRSSLLCQITGAIAVLSSEVSLMLISLISADRLKNIVFPFNIDGLTNKAAHALCFIIWIVGFIFAFLPTFGIQYFKAPNEGHHYYGRSVVCIPLQLSDYKAPGWEYSVAVFVGLNLAFVAFVVVAYLVIVGNRLWVQAMSANTQRETALAKRVFFIILTDCICWMPVIVIGLRSLVEKSFRTPGDLAVWIAVFVLPFNSAINPILYTLSTTQETRKEPTNPKLEKAEDEEPAEQLPNDQNGLYKEAEEEPEKEQEEVHKHNHSCLEHTEPQDTCKWKLNTKHKEPARPEQPETEPTDSIDKIAAMKTETKDHKQSQKDVAANSEYEEFQTDFQGDQDQSTDEVQIQQDLESDDSDDSNDESKDRSEDEKIVEHTNHEEPEERDETEEVEKPQDKHEDPLEKKDEPEKQEEESEEQHEDDVEDEPDKTLSWGRRTVYRE